MSAPHVFATATLQSLPNAQTSVLIVVDVAYVVGFGAGEIRAGIYMFDDQRANGSADEGTLDLSTRCNVGDVISWEVVPLDPTRGDALEITSITALQDTLFGTAGAPTDWPNTSNWYGQAMTAGSATYQIMLKITAGAIRKQVYEAYWTASISDVKPPK
jgi:hypothetical protein